MGEVVQIENHLRKPVRKGLRIQGNIPYYGANNIQDRVRDYTHEGEYVLVAEDGVSKLENYSVQYVLGKFAANNHVHVIRGVKDVLLTKFLYYFLKTIDFTPYLCNFDRPKINKSSLIKIPIPILPICVQEKIVAQLDVFEQYTNNITGLLPQLIQYHEQQYQYYRDQLLKVND